jgi:hypothetical protein
MNPKGRPRMVPNDLLLKIIKNSPPEREFKDYLDLLGYVAETLGLDPCKGKTVFVFKLEMSYIDDPLIRRLLKERGYFE